MSPSDASLAEGEVGIKAEGDQVAEESQEEKAKDEALEVSPEEKTEAQEASREIKVRAMTDSRARRVSRAAISRIAMARQAKLVTVQEKSK